MHSFGSNTMLLRLTGHERTGEGLELVRAAVSGSRPVEPHKSDLPENIKRNAAESTLDRWSIFIPELTPALICRSIRSSSSGLQ